METVKNTVKQATGSDSQFASGQIKLHALEGHRLTVVKAIQYL